jgi:hypothetical protein
MCGSGANQAYKWYCRNLAEVLTSGNPNLDSENAHPIAYQRILDACCKFASPPVFYRSDQPETMPPDMIPKVPVWMNSVEQISIGNRVQVLEDGNDVCDSESDSDTEDYGLEIKDGYKGISTNVHGDPLSSAHKVTTEQANAMRAASHQTAQSIPPLLIPAQEEQKKEPVQERKATPMNSDNEDLEGMS